MMCFDIVISDPSTLGAGAKARLESRIKKFTPHCVCRPLYVEGLTVLLGGAKQDANVRRQKAVQRKAAKYFEFAEGARVKLQASLDALWPPGELELELERCKQGGGSIPSSTHPQPGGGTAINDINNDIGFGAHQSGHRLDTAQPQYPQYPPGGGSAGTNPAAHASPYSGLGHPVLDLGAALVGGVMNAIGGAGVMGAMPSTPSAPSAVQVQAEAGAPSNVDMGTDPAHPPTEFTHAEWCAVRDSAPALCM